MMIYSVLSKLKSGRRSRRFDDVKRIQENFHGTRTKPIRKTA